MLREGGNHTILSNAQGKEIVVPRHNDLNRFTVRGMAKDAGVDWKKFRGEVS